MADAEGESDNGIVDVAVSPGTFDVTDLRVCFETFVGNCADSVDVEKCADFFVMFGEDMDDGEEEAHNWENFHHTTNFLSRLLSADCNLDTLAVRRDRRGDAIHDRNWLSKVERKWVST